MSQINKDPNSKVVSKNRQGAIGSVAAASAVIAAGSVAQAQVEVQSPATVNAQGQLVIDTVTGPVTINAGGYSLVQGVYYISPEAFAALDLLAQQALTSYMGAITGIGAVGLGGLSLSLTCLVTTKFKFPLEMLMRVCRLSMA